LRCSWIEYLARAQLGFMDLTNQTNADIERLAIRFRKAPLVILEVDDRTADMMAAAAGDAWPGLQIVSPF
jgi:hypothetical protein